MVKKYTPKKAKDNEVLLKDWAIPIAESNDEVIFDAVNGHIDGTNDRHNAEDVDFGDGETVKDKLDVLINSSEELSETKVDKVDGKSLIDSGVADKLTADDNSVTYKSADENASLKVENIHEGLGLTLKDTKVKAGALVVTDNQENSHLSVSPHNITIETTNSDKGSIDISSNDNFYHVNMSNKDGIVCDCHDNKADVTVVRYDDNLNVIKHKLSQKANITDLDGKVDKNKEFKITDSSSESVYATYGSKKIQVYDGVDAFAETTITPTGIAGTGSDGSYSLKIGDNGGLHIEDVANNTDISISKSDGNGGKTIHKLSEKANKSEVLSANMDKDTVIKMGDYDVESYAAQYSSDKIMFRNHNWAIGDTVYGSDELKIQENGTHKVVINNRDGINVTQVPDGADPADISLTIKDPATYKETTHKLSEKADKVDITALNNAITMAKFETRELDNSGWDGGSAPISVAIDLRTVTELYFYGGTGSVMLSSSGENYAIAKTRDEATNLIPLIKPQTAANNCDIYVMTAGLFYADIGTGVAINEYVKAIPQIYEDSGSLYVNVGDKKFKLTAAEV